MRVVLLWACALILPLSIPQAASATATCTASSGVARLSLLELYTSEGCSSCPPADRWFSQLPAAGSGVVPLAFHVDYWDQLGWKDPYAQAAFSQRQRARNSRLGWVYTPQVMRDGQDFRDWPRGVSVVGTGSTPARVRLNLTLTQVPQRIEVQAESRSVDTAAPEAGEVYLALTENRLQSSVTAGENARTTLRHDHVVRALAGPFPAQQARTTFALQPGWKAADLGVVAFALDGKGQTLQALAQPLAACP
jgi:hypothetical protein